jgi:hypothetical protein
MNVEDPQRDLYHELTVYTLSHQDPSFIHQHAVDAFAAQTAGETTKPITLTFALVGLYLRSERQYSGRQCSGCTCRWPDVVSSGRDSTFPNIGER